MKHRGAAEARRAHNPDVAGSKPADATIYFLYYFLRFWDFRVLHIPDNPTFYDLLTFIDNCLLIFMIVQLFKE